MRFWAYCWVSTMLFTAMVAETLLVYPNYFSALVGVADSAVKACIVINFACMLTAIWSKLVVAIFLRDLNNGELQTVYQRGWLFLCNSLLYWGTFNSKVYVNPYNLGVCMISVLVVLVLHCVCRSRVRALQAHDPSNMRFSFLFSVFKLAVLCFTLLLIDVVVCGIALTRFRERDFTLTLFSFFLIDLVEMSIAFCGELIINIFSLHYLYHHEDEDEWEQSALLTQIVRVSASVLAMYGHIQLVLTFGIWYSDSWSFFGRAFKLFRNVDGLRKVLRAQSDMDRFTLSPSAEELQRDNTCVICRDEMLLADAGHKRKAARKLRCGHVMHTACLASWIKRSASCPTCRQPVHSAASSFREQSEGRDSQGPETNAQGGEEPGTQSDMPRQPVRDAETNEPLGDQDLFNMAIQNSRLPSDRQRRVVIDVSQLVPGSSAGSSAGTENVVSRTPVADQELTAPYISRNSQSPSGSQGSSISQSPAASYRPASAKDSMDEELERLAYPVAAKLLKNLHERGSDRGSSSSSGSEGYSDSRSSPIVTSKNHPQPETNGFENNVAGAVNMEMKGENNGILAGRFHFSFENVN